MESYGIKSENFKIRVKKIYEEEDYEVLIKEQTTKFGIIYEVSMDKTKYKQGTIWFSGTCFLSYLEMENNIKNGVEKNETYIALFNVLETLLKHDLLPDLLKRKKII